MGGSGPSGHACQLGPCPLCRGRCRCCDDGRRALATLCPWQQGAFARSLRQPACCQLNQHSTMQGVVPDIVTMAKGIGNGLHLAAVVATPEISQVMTRKLNFNTFGGNPVVSAGGRAVLQAIDEDGTQQNSAQVGLPLP